MFTKATEAVGRYLCAVMDPSDAEQKEILGQGCMLNERSVLTALHVVERLSRNGGIIVNGSIGMWTASVNWKSEAADLALLQLEVPRKGDHDLVLPQSFPTISANSLRLGMQLGYSSLLTTLDKFEEHPYLPQCFHSGWVSRQVHGKDHIVYLLSPGYITLSFSGAPVFFDTGELCGVLLGPDHLIAKQPGPPGSRHLAEYDFFYPRVLALEPLRTEISQHI